MAIIFYRVNEEYGYFSNFYKARFALDGEYWPTVEHYFQWKKFEGHPEVQKEIKAAKWAGMAWKIANSKYPQLVDFVHWESIRDEVMLKALKAKFSQNPEMARLLEETGNQLIVEHTANDNYWADGGDGTGINRLGELLMKVRNELNKNY